MRALAVAAAVTLVVRGWEERGGFFWVGVALLLLNIAGYAASRRAAEEGTGPAAPPDGRPHRLVELRHLPAVAAALAAAPPRWQQVSCPEEAFGPFDLDEVLAHVWLEPDGADWLVAVDDELKPYLDLDVDERGDPALRTFLAHPSVAAAWHEDREVYRVETARGVGLEELGALAVHALAAHHGDAAARLPRPE